LLGCAPESGAGSDDQNGRTPSALRSIPALAEHFSKQLGAVLHPDRAPSPSGEGYQIRSARPVLLPRTHVAEGGLGQWRRTAIGVEASFPRTADGRMVFGPIGDARRVAVQRLDPSAAPGHLEEGLLVYPRASRSVDALFYARGDTVEELLVVHDADAEIGYAFDLPPGSSLRASRDTLVEVCDETQSAWLRLRFEQAWDRRGAPVRMRVVTDGRTVHLQLHGAPLFPILVDPSWEGTATMVEARQQHAATILSSGKVLIAGGWKGGSLASAEIYDPSGNDGLGSFTAVPGSMQDRRLNHTATLLPSGKVLLAGGQDTQGLSRLATTDVFDSNGNQGAGSLVAGPPLLLGHARHSATLLEKSGQVLFLGGRLDFGASAEFYTPGDGVGSFSLGASLLAGRDAHSATLLKDGTVLVTGGIPHPVDATKAAEIFDPDYVPMDPGAPKGMSIQIGNLSEARLNHTATLLPNGDVLIAGGSNKDDGGGLSTVERYNATKHPDASAGTFSALPEPMHAPRGWHTATLLNNGWVLLVGGPALSDANHAELFDPLSLTFHLTEPVLPDLPATRILHTATLLSSGEVLIAGGGAPTDTAERFVPRDDGSPCASGGACRNGHCIDGVCCDSVCDGFCQACAGEKTGAPSGICAPVSAGTDLDAECDTKQPTTCGQDGFCDGKGACARYPAGTACGGGFACSGTGDPCPSACDDDAACDAQSRCDVTSGACVPALVCDGEHHLKLTDGPVQKDCSPFRCLLGNIECPVVCGSAVDCVDGFRCDEARACVPSSSPEVFASGCGCRSARDTEGSGGLAALLGLWIAAQAGCRRAPRGRRS
jgi:hypothetical protein